LHFLSFNQPCITLSASAVVFYSPAGIRRDAKIAQQQGPLRVNFNSVEIVFQCEGRLRKLYVFILSVLFPMKTHQSAWWWWPRLFIYLSHFTICFHTRNVLWNISTRIIY